MKSLGSNLAGLQSPFISKNIQGNPEKIKLPSEASQYEDEKIWLPYLHKHGTFFNTIKDQDIVNLRLKFPIPDKQNYHSAEMTMDDGDDSVADPNYSFSGDDEISSDEFDESATGITAKAKTRKRKANPAKWKRNIAKERLNVGKKYQSKFSNKIVDRREMRPGCGEQRQYKCSKKIEDESRFHIFRKYWSLGDVNRQQDFISRCIKEVNRTQSKNEDARSCNNKLYTNKTSRIDASAVLEAKYKLDSKAVKNKIKSLRRNMDRRTYSLENENDEEIVSMLQDDDNDEGEGSFGEETDTDEDVRDEDIEREECSKRWAYVRDYYLRRRGKPGTGSGGELAKKRSDLLSFLDSIPSSKRSTMTNVEGPMDSQTDCTDSDEINPIQDLENHFSSAAEEPSEGGGSLPVVLQPRKRMASLSGNPSSSGSDDTSEGGRSPLSIPQPKKQRKTSLSEERMQILKQIAAKNSSPNEMDENDLFFSSMAKSVKKLPPPEQARIRMEVGQLVGSAEVAHFSRVSSEQPSYVNL
ncbi:hypothetical protein GE061_015558 [Apolygus lucorum]|uniref:Uncharacterized protein n=1 Tax=Apolygus lucorum TaxID=248454 RepID=A0A6A4JD74_APOLU|nr:hypothetical protein GE061_015558 [Apolygus lucorum]